MVVGKAKKLARSWAFMKLCLMFAGSMSVRDGGRTLNRILWRSGTKELKLRTYADFCQCQGERIEEAIARESAKALEENRFDGGSGTLRQKTLELLL